MNVALWISLAVVFGISFLLILNAMKNAPTCPECESTAVSMLSKEQVGMPVIHKPGEDRIFETMKKISDVSNDKAGMPVIHSTLVSATIHYEYRYYCKKCDTRWNTVKVESR